MKWKALSMKILVMILVVSLIGCSSNPSNQEKTTEKTTEKQQQNTQDSNILKIAHNTGIATLDPDMTTAKPTMELARPIFETLVASDSKFEPQPMLAESWEISDDLKTYTFHLRKGVLFHNGKEMTSEDVVASMNRWKELSVIARANLVGSNFTAIDPYTVKLQLEKPNLFALEVLMNPMQFAAIMPKEVIENAAPDGVKEYIGTGPYKLKEYKVGSYIDYTAFKDYQPVSAPADGLAGKKEALIENIRVEFVSDATTRVAGLQTGQFDFITLVPKDQYELFKNDDQLASHINFYGFEFLFFNQKEGFFKNKTARQAVQAALNMDQILKGAFVHEDFYELDHSLATKKQEDWYNDTGKELYNQNDPEKAKQLLEQAGYNGEEVTLITTPGIPFFHMAALTIQQQLKAIGMNVKLESYDFPTLTQRRENPELWDMFITAFPAKVIPSTHVFLHSKNGYPGWTNNDKIDKLVEEINGAKSQEEASKLFTQLMEEYYDYVPTVKLGNWYEFHGSRSNIKGLGYSHGGIVLWNVEKK